ncbi:molybdate ABC transporter substrate-binding protein [Kocuria rosea]|uniref:molybdate ABC transporter substrate-binding protein n=1 Tax=Kocuria rosea TaxID=1275 RepID=UPI002540B9D5|nr:molybdate ABC transporter substrate-binding protein [Kocuria rosea]WIG17759.1 molybdate ABC transporter substrate-binding protein [Kocuria rosea]
MRTRAPASAVLLAALGLGATGCGTGGDPATVLDVHAAASLTGTFTELAERFEAQHPGVEVSLSFAGSSTLVQQLTEGAPADVLATADERSMAGAVAAGLVDGEPEVFATNVLTVVVPAGNPAGVASFRDLAEPGVQVVVCAPQVPCGAARERVQEFSGVRLSPVSEEGSVTDVLGKVVSGQADAGLVYATDARSAGDAVEVVEVPQAAQAVTRSPVAALADSEEPELARQFTELVAGDRGREVLAGAGFGAP